MNAVEKFLVQEMTKAKLAKGNSRELILTMKKLIAIFNIVNPKKGFNVSFSEK